MNPGGANEKHDTRSQKTLTAHRHKELTTINPNAIGISSGKLNVYCMELCVICLFICISTLTTKAQVELCEPWMFFYSVEKPTTKIQLNIWLCFQVISAIF